MLQDPAAGSLLLARHYQTEMRASISASRRAPQTEWPSRRTRVIKLRPARQPSFIVQPHPAQLRKMFAGDVPA
jgi:hypothetical protein